MRTSLKCLCLALMLLLSGCEKDFATLAFESSPQAPGNQYSSVVPPSIREQLGALFQEHGIDPEQIRMRVLSAKQPSIVLSNPFFGGIDETQEAALRGGLQAIIEGRNAPIEVTFTLRPENMSPEAGRSREEAFALPQDYRVVLGVKTVVLGVSYSVSDMLDSVVSKSHMRSAATCNLSMSVEPALPFYALRTRTTDHAENSHSFRKGRSSNSASFIPVDITASQPELQALLKSGKIMMSTELTGSSQQMRQGAGIRQLEIQFGDMSEITHDHAKIDFYSHIGLKAHCWEKVGAIGRPFSYIAGDTLDRLIRVTFY